MLRRNATGHMRRLRRANPPAHQALSTRLDGVLNQIDGKTGIPRTLDLTGQGEFILGYHHQRAADIAAAMARAAQKRAATDNEGEDS
jgi:CRISPR-associated protein Csd1